MTVRMRFLLPFFIIFTTSISAQTEKVIVGAEHSYPPYSYLDSNDEITGFSIGLINSVLQVLNIDYEYKIESWDNVKKLFFDNKIDVLPLVGRTPEREALFDFTFPYLTMNGTVVVKKGTLVPHDFQDLEWKKVGVMKGDNAEEYVRRQETNVELVLTETFSEALLLLSEGKIDAVIIQKLLAFQLIDELKLDNLVVSENFLEGFSQSFCFAVQKGNNKLLEKLNEGLAITIRNGIYDKLQTSWFTNNGLKRKTRDHIIIGGDSDYPPYEYIDVNGEPAGYNVELTKAIAKIMNLNIKIELAPWNETYYKLINNEIDMVQGLFYSIERDKQMEFSQPHSIINHVIVNRVGKRSITDINELKNKKIIVLHGDIIHEYLSSIGLDKNLILEDSIGQILIKLSEGKGDCALIAQMPAYYWIDKYDIPGLVVGKNTFLSPEYGYSSLDENSELLLPFKQGLSILKINGTYHEIYSKWLQIYENNDHSSDKILKNILFVLLILVLIIILILIWTASLKKQVIKRTMELSQSEQKFKTAITDAPVPMLIHSHNGVVININKKWTELSGYDINQITNIEDWINLAHPSRTLQEKEFIKTILNNRSTNISNELNIACFNGNERIWEFYTVEIAGSNNDKLIMIVVNDLTNKKIQEHKLLKLNKAIEQSPVSIIITNEHGRIEYVNNKTTEISGYKKAELINEYPSIFKSFQTDPIVYKELWDTITNGNDWSGKLLNKKKNGTQYWEDINISPVFDSNGKITNYVATKQDVTQIIIQNEENKKLQEQLLHKSKMDVVGQLAGGIAHDFNNVLNGIINAAQIMKESPDFNDSKQSHYIDIILKASKRATSLSAKLLTFSRKQDNLLSPISINNLLTDILEVINNTVNKSISVHLDLKAYDSTVLGNESDLYNTFLNLCINASQAMPLGGYLTLKTGNKEILKDYENNTFNIKAGNYCYIEIIDTGKGISKSNMEKIFEPFFTTKPLGEGTGLGLAAVYGSITNHNGLVEVESKLNEGTTFRILLPVTEQVIKINDNIKSVDQLGSGLILFVDDEEINRIVGKEIIESLGYKTCIAASGYEALKIFETQKDNISVSIIDFMMPDMNGKELFLKLRELDSECKIILSSGFFEESEILYMRELGLNGELDKPYRKNDLSNILKDVIG